GTFLFQFSHPNDPNLSGSADDVEVDNYGNIFVMDGIGWGATPRIVKYDRFGKELAVFNSFGPVSWWRFSDLALDDQGNLYLADLYGGTVIKLDPKGKYLQTIASEGQGKGQLLSPNALTV